MRNFLICMGSLVNKFLTGLSSSPSEIIFVPHLRLVLPFWRHRSLQLNDPCCNCDRLIRTVTQPFDISDLVSLFLITNATICDPNFIWSQFRCVLYYFWHNVSKYIYYIF